jgi:hypothetical protein
MLKLNYNSKVATSRNVGKKDLVNGYKTNNCYFKHKWANIYLRLGFKKATVAIGIKIL